MTWTMNGRLETAKGESSGLGECRIEVLFDQVIPAAVPEPTAPQPPPEDDAPPEADGEIEEGAGAGAEDGAAGPPEEDTDVADAPLVVRGRVVVVSGPTGAFTAVLPDRRELGGKTLRFQVFAPSGDPIADITRVIARIDDVVRIPVRKVERISMEPRGKVTEPESYRVTGRVIERNGRPLPANLQVLVFAVAKGAKTADSPALVARADSSGYFGGDVPNQTAGSAFALVGGVPDPVVVALEGDRIPARLAIVVELPAGAEPHPKDDCECGSAAPPPRTPSHADIETAPETYSTDLGTGQCVQFNTPNRAIEEFNFYSVVRTTEPAIRGVTLTDEMDDPAVAPPTGTAPPPPPPPPPPVDPRVLAASYAVRLDTGERGSWGAVWVNLITEEGARYVIYAKDSVNHAAGGNPFPNTNDPGLAGLVLNTNTRTSATVSANAGGITGIGVDMRDVRRVEVEWVESNGGDAWGFAGIEVTVSTTANETIPLLVNGVQHYTQPGEIQLFNDSGRTHQTWSAPAQIGPRPARAVAAQAATAVVNMRAAALDLPIRMRLPSDFGHAVPKPLGRAPLDVGNPVDWDSTPTFYEAATIAHGHLLHFKQTWYADGYSLGDLLYSLPLAPGQKKLISVVDWERRERADRAEATFASEELNAALTHDRDLGEVVTGALTESVRGGSKNTTAGVGAGTGAAGNGSYEAFNFGALLGVSGGYGESNSEAWQASSRTIASTSLQNLRDNTLQSASAIRGLRSSVVHSVSQGEAVRATTEVVANHNHCHAITIQYFEVLRHLKLVHELTDVQECLFVPLPMSEFDRRKTLRWRQALETYLQRRELAGGFDAARRVETAWSEVDYPVGRYADETVTSLAGELQLTIVIPLPPFPERPKPDPAEAAADTAKKVEQAVNPTTGPFGILLAIATGGASLVAGAVTDATIDATKSVTQGARAMADEFYALTPQERYDKFQQEIMPAVAAGFVDQLELWALVGTSELRLSGADFTLVSNYQPGVPLLVGLRATLSGGIRRSDISQLIVRSTAGLPNGCRVIVDSAAIRYRTRGFEHAFVDDQKVNDDIDLPPVTATVTNGWEVTIRRLRAGTGVALYTPIDTWEQRSPRIEDSRLAAELLDHLDDNLEFYHHAIWWTMDPNRRYMLLDGYVAGADGRSVASVVENQLIGIVGNSLILPVARGNHLDPRFQQAGAGKAANLLDFYALESPAPPTRVSLPTRGVFAEAVMGACNACEQIDDSKFWRWQDEPIDEPPAIGAASTDSRRSDPLSADPTAFPTPLVSIQAAGGVPDPAGVRAAFDTLSKQSFADITGLAGTQANAAAAYSQAVDTALQYGKEASKLAQQAAMLGAKDKALGAIDSAEEQGKIDPASAKDLRMKALGKMVGDVPTDEKAASVSDRLKVVGEQEANGSITAAAAAALRDSVMKGLQPDEATGDAEQSALTTAIGGIPKETIQKIETQDPSGATRSITTSAGSSDGLLGWALQTALGASPMGPSYWSRPDKLRVVTIGAPDDDGVMKTYDFDFEPPVGGVAKGKIDGPGTHNGWYTLTRNEPGFMEMDVNFGTDAAQTNDLHVKLSIRNGVATLTGIIKEGTPKARNLGPNGITAPVKGIGTRAAPFKVEFTGASLEWF